MTNYQVEGDLHCKLGPIMANFYKTVCTVTADSNTQTVPSTKETSLKTFDRVSAHADNKTATTMTAHMIKT